MKPTAWLPLAVGGLVLAITATLAGSPTPAAADEDGSPAQQEGGGALPGEKVPVAPGADSGADSTADAAPAVSATFVDDYSRAWRRVERGKLKIRSLGEDLVAARQVIVSSSSDYALAIRVRNRASAQLVDAQDQFTQAVRDLYVRGTTDVDVILGVLREAVKNVLDRDRIKIRLNPRDHERVSKLTPGLIAGFEGIRSITLEADPGISAGGAVIETAFGEIDATLEQQLEEILKAFLQNGQKS